MSPHHLLKHARGNAQEREGTERKEHSERPNLVKVKKPQNIEEALTAIGERQRSQNSKWSEHEA